MSPGEPSTDTAPWAGRIVTVSAAYGAGGPVIAANVAERLGLPFFDRAIPAAVARSLAVPIEAAIERDEHRASLVERIILAMAAGGAAFEVGPIIPTERVIHDDQAFRTRTEEVIREQADSGAGGVVLGRGGAMVLRDHPRTVLRVRLTGSPEARARSLLAHGNVSAKTVSKLVDDHDRATRDYVRHFYKVELDEVGLYHLVIDSTEFPFDACADLVVAAVRARITGSAAGVS